jgi:hyaluronan synthase
MDESFLRRAGREAPSISLFRQCCNAVGCALGAYIFFQGLQLSRHPLTLDVLFTIFLAEYNRWQNNNRRRKADAAFAVPSLDDRSKDTVDAPCLHDNRARQPECIAAIVGYREDPVFFNKCLRSYIDASHCCFVLVGIDGDEAEDLEMLELFEQVSL